MTDQYSHNVPWGYFMFPADKDTMCTTEWYSVEPKANDSRQQAFGSTEHHSVVRTISTVSYIAHSGLFALSFSPITPKTD